MSPQKIVAFLLLIRASFAVEFFFPVHSTLHCCSREEKFIIDSNAIKLVEHLLEFEIFP